MAQLHSSGKGRHVQRLDQQHLPGDESTHSVEAIFMLWIKAACQPLAWTWTSAGALLRYRLAGLCIRKPGVFRKVASTDADCLGSEPVYLESKVVGLTSSGAYGHTLGMSLAFAYIDADCGDATEFTIELQGQQVAAQVLSKPKYDPDNLRLKS